MYSGRGRPRKEVSSEATTTATTSNGSTTGGDRPLPVGIVLGSPSSPAMTDLYKNRKIRVGGPFQAKVPKHRPVDTTTSTGRGYVSTRPAPSRVSRWHPHLTEEEVEEHDRQQRTMAQEQEPTTAAEESIDQLTAAEGKKRILTINYWMKESKKASATRGGGGTILAVLKVA